MKLRKFWAVGDACRNAFDTPLDLPLMAVHPRIAIEHLAVMLILQ